MYCLFLAFTWIKKQLHFVLQHLFGILLLICFLETCYLDTTEYSISKQSQYDRKEKNLHFHHRQFL